jgi:hypothetical protein
MQNEDKLALIPAFSPRRRRNDFSVGCMLKAMGRGAQVSPRKSRALQSEIRNRKSEIEDGSNIV